MNLNILFSIQNYNNIESILQCIKERSRIEKYETVNTYIENSVKRKFSIDNSKLKGGFIADVIKLKIYDGLNIIDCVAKYENVNEQPYIL